VPRLDDATWSFFVFFSQDDIFMALALALALWEEVARECDASSARTHQLMKCWAATAHATPRGLAINTGAEAQALSRRSAASA
jgi:hypothetical protein